MTALPLRLRPGQDLRRALEEAVGEAGQHAAFVTAGIGSLSVTRLRLAGADEPIDVAGDVELLTLSGSVSPNGAHLHMSIADARGNVRGGHVAYGCIVRTTAELLLVLLPDWRFGREADATTGYAELVIGPRPEANEVTLPSMSPSVEAPVQRQLEAYNDRDLARFVAEYADDVTVFRPPSSEPVLSGKAAFAAYYAAHRFDLPALRADVLTRMVVGNKVIDHERVRGVRDQPFDAAVVYEVRDGLINTVWFFDAA